MRHFTFLALLSVIFTISSYSQTVSTLAGSSQGYLDGDNLSAQFDSPFDVCVNSEGTIYVSDQNNTIRKISTSGIVSTLAGNTSAGYTDGAGTSAQFYTPNSLCVDSNGIIYVADYNNNKIRKITPEGVVSTLAGSSQGYSDGVGTNAQFYLPQGVCVDTNGNIYVADGQNNMIRKITPDGVVTTLAGSTAGYQDGEGSTAKFNFPTRVAVDDLGYVYVTDTFNNKIRKISPIGNVTTLAGSSFGFNNGIGTAAQFKYPMGLCVDSSRNVYVSDGNNNRIRKITPDGNVTTYAGNTQGYLDGNINIAQFYSPTGVCVDNSGTIYVTDRNNYKIRKIISSLDVPENNIDLNGFKIYPNPVTEILNIEVNSFSSNDEITITDLNGKIILVQKIETINTRLNTSSLCAGIYIVTTNNGNKKIIRKIVVE